MLFLKKFLNNAKKFLKSVDNAGLVCYNDYAVI